MTKAYGRRNPIRFPGKTDCHPDKKRGYVNWWEVECDNPCKKRARREAKKEIEKELKEKQNEKI